MASAAGSSPIRTWLVRAEDWILAGWVALAAPFLIRLQGSPTGSGDSSAGVFDGGRPVDGLLGLIAILGALGCLALRRPDGSTERGFVESGAVGPFVGGLLLVGVSSAAALNIESDAVIVLAGIAGIGLIVIRAKLPPASSRVRRALVTPYVLVTATLFWRLIDSVTGVANPSGALRSSSIADLQAAAPVLGFLLAFAAVYYAMLVYAPRQVAEPEGGAATWLLRFALFVGSVAFGLTWLVAVGG